MKNPNPVNMMTNAEVFGQGWIALSRDGDGHLATSHAPFESDVEMVEYIKQELWRGHEVTIRGASFGKLEEME